MLKQKYFVHGVRLESVFEIPDLMTRPSGRTDLQLALESPLPSGMGDLANDVLLLQSFYERPDGERLPFTYHRLGERYVARWHHLCDFEIWCDGTRIVCHPWSEASWADVRPFLLGRVLPLAMNLRGVVTLHGGGVLLPDGAISLVANGGTGKSTLLATLACQGWPLIADDVLAIDEIESEFCAHWGSAQIRLTAESMDVLESQLPQTVSAEPDFDKTKVLLRTDYVTPAPLPLKAIYLLERRPDLTGDIEISFVSPKEGLSILMLYTTNVILLERPQFQRQFTVLSRLVSQVPLKILSYPSNFDLLPDVCDVLLEDQRSLQNKPNVTLENPPQFQNASRR